MAPDPEDDPESESPEDEEGNGEEEEAEDSEEAESEESEDSEEPEEEDEEQEDEEPEEEEPEEEGSEEPDEEPEEDSEDEPEEDEGSEQDDDEEPEEEEEDEEEGDSEDESEDEGEDEEDEAEDEDEESEEDEEDEDEEDGDEQSEDEEDEGDEEDDEDTALVAASDEDDDGANTLVVGDDETHTVRLRLFDPFTEGLSDVPYRLTLGQETKEDTTADGWVEMEVQEIPEKCTIEWGEGDESGTYRYSKEAYLQFEDLDDDELRKRRLHNLGYEEDGDGAENLSAFKDDYGIDGDHDAMLASWFDDPESVEKRGETLQGGDAPEPPPKPEPEPAAGTVQLVDDAGEALAGVACADGSTTDSEGRIPLADGAAFQADAASLAEALRARSFDRAFAPRADETRVTVKQLVNEGVTPSGSGATVMVVARVIVTVRRTMATDAGWRVVDPDGNDVQDGVESSPRQVVVKALALGEGRILRVLTKDSEGQDYEVSQLDLDALAAGGDLTASFPDDVPETEDIVADEEETWPEPPPDQAEPEPEPVPQRA